MSAILPGFHRVLNRVVWSPLHLSRMLLGLLVMAFLAPDAPLSLLIDGTASTPMGTAHRLQGSLPGCGPFTERTRRDRAVGSTG